MRARAVWVILAAPLAAAWTAGGGLARPCSRAAPRTCAPAAQAVDAGGTRANPDEAPAAPRFVWGATDVTDVGSSGPGDGSGLLVKLSAAYGWCLTPEEQAELDAYEAQLTNATTSYLEQDDLARLKLALEITYQSRDWAEQSRSDSRLQHAVAVALVLADLRMEANAVSAALLAGVCEDTGITRSQISMRLGATVASAVSDVSKVWRLASLLRAGGNRAEIAASAAEIAQEIAETENAEASDVAGVFRPEIAEIAGASEASEKAEASDVGEAALALGEADPAELERRCQMLLAGCDDWRGVVLSLASRLVSMRQLRATPNAFGPEISPKAFATQTLQVFVPLAHRLGMWYFKTELEELCFAVTDPATYAELTADLSRLEADNRRVLEEAATNLRDALKADPVLSSHTEWIRVQERMKAPYSTWTKMRKKGAGLGDLNDVLGLRVILKPKSSGFLPAQDHWQRQAMLSYRALEVLHSIYRPVLGRRVKDYIASPKPNGYQSIHSSAQVGEVSAEVQVRTSEMHYFAEHGKASHWLYKAEEGRPVDQWQRIARIASDKAAADKGASRAARGSDAAAVTAVFGSAPQRSASSANSAINSPIADDDLIETAREAVAADSEDSADPPRNSPRIERQTDRPGKRRGGSRDLGSGLAKSGSRSPLLEWLRQSIRETQVYAVVNVDDASTVLTLPVDATLRDAMVAAAADKLVDVDEGVVMNARVNGRAVRAEYKIRNGDVLTPLAGSTIEIARDEKAEPVAAQESSEDEVNESDAPWPWSLIETDPNEWYGVAEAKHGAVALVALSNWLFLAAIGETSLESTLPLAALAEPVARTAWGGVFGAVALCEARDLQRETTATLGEFYAESAERRRRAEGGRTRSRADADGRYPWDAGGAGGVGEGLSLGSWVRLTVGRVSMIAVAVLALHADLEHGLLRDFLTTQSGQPVLNEVLREAAPERPPSYDPIDSLVADVVPQDVDLEFSDRPF